MKLICPIHGEQEFRVNANNDAFCPLCYQETLESFLSDPRYRRAHEDTTPDTRPRCKRSGNPCGTDTWVVGYVCDCESCQKWFYSLPKERQEYIRWGLGGDPLKGD